MSQSRFCPSCGEALPAEARYCPNCGMRLPETAGAPSFEEAIADVLGAPDPGAEQTPLPPPPPLFPPASEPVVEPPPRDNVWTAAPASSGGSPGGWGQATAPAAPMVEAPGNRLVWIMLAVLGFIWFFCCGFAFIVFAIDASG
jgi:hypothetical protein